MAVNLYRSVRAVAGSSGSHPIDWKSAAAGAKAATDPGSITLEPGEREAFARDVRDARTRIRSVSGLEFDLPTSIQIQNRHHWIDANADSFERLMAPLDHRFDAFPGVARTINTGTMTVLLAFLGRNVLGQYDPLLLADSPQDDHGLYFVRPNIHRVAAQLEVDVDRFRRWIAFHEVTHAAEFGAAAWLPSHLEGHIESGIDTLASGGLDRDAFRELDATMTVVEGYAELLMDRAFDDEYADLRQKLDARRQGRGPLQQLFRKLLGLGLKRRQYERGAAFFEHVVDAHRLELANRVWDDPDSLPTQAELDAPATWVRRVRS